LPAAVFTAPASFAAAAENTEWVGGETLAHPFQCLLIAG